MHDVTVKALWVMQEHSETGMELTAILDAMADGLFVLDCQRIVRRWNPAMERMTGYSAAETVGQRCGVFDWLEQDTSSGDQGVYCRLFAAGSMDRSEHIIKCKDGATIPALISARLLKDDKGNATGAVITVTDISTIKRLEQEVEHLRQEVTERYQFHHIIGKSHSMQRVFQMIEQAADSDTTVLILGETGTGKELVAKAIHVHSNRKNGPLVCVNCSALSETLVESELFGHAKGSFTGALSDRIGRFEQAHGGTLFLDEVGEIPLSVQVKLLRVLQEREIERIGESRPRKVDVRIITATHRDLREQVEKGVFREDLFYRLKVYPIQLPTLRERKEDIDPLVTHFIEKFNRQTGRNIIGLKPDAMRLMMDYCWPGNIRELENAIEHAFVTCTQQQIDVMDLPVEIRRTDIRDRICNRRPMQPQPLAAIPQLTSRHPASESDIRAALQASGWNKAEAARQLGLTRTHLWRRMNQLNIPLNPNME